MISSFYPQAITPNRAAAPFRLRLLALAVMASVVGLAQAQQEALTPASVGAKGTSGQSELTHVEADQIDGRTDVSVRALGDARLRRGNLQLNGEVLILDQLSNDVSAEGKVKMSRGLDWVSGPRARMNLDTYFGEFQSPNYSFMRPEKQQGAPFQTSLPEDDDTSLSKLNRPEQSMVTATGSADLLKLEGENQYRLSNATYSTCGSVDPDWYLKISDLQLDYDQEQGTGYHSTMYFGNVPIMYSPWTSFPLNGGRQSGLLPPTVGTGSNTGLDLTLPYYFNIAPNYDATFAPRLMTTRGLQLNGEFRYLTARTHGVLRGEYLSKDSQTEKMRSLVQWQHDQNFDYGFSGHVDYGRASDADYFADLSSGIVTTSQSTINQQAILSYGNGTWLTSSVNVQRYQTLTGGVPYNRLPQVLATATFPDVKGFALSAPMDYTYFDHPTLDAGSRFVVRPQVAYPIQVPAGFITPKVSVQMSQYNLARRITPGDPDQTTSVPIYSVDSGLNFERDVSFFNKTHTQTLEPRLFYLYVPYRNQSDVPVFDTALADFNFSQLFSENRYAGSDRVGDANQLTAALTSRFIESNSGAEWLRMSVGQRYYFADQKVTLPGESPRTSSVADVLGAVSGRVWKSTWVDTTYQYNPNDGRTEYAVATLRYQPDFAKVVTASYRYKKDLNGFKDLDFSAQWPISSKWYAVGRYNLNLQNHKLSQAIAGIEYKANCWVLRFAWQTLYTSKQTYNNGWFLQVEFNGLASVGFGDPAQLLKRNITGYGNINQPPQRNISDPVFGGSSHF